MADTVCGVPGFRFGQGVLALKESLAPAVVRATKIQAEHDGVAIIDAAPGTGCPVVEAMDGADVVLLVTEPTPFGLHDLKLAAAMSLKLGLPTGIVINRSDGHDEIIHAFADKSGIPVVGTIPFERRYAEVYSGGGIMAAECEELVPLFGSIYESAVGLRKFEVLGVDSVSAWGGELEMADEAEPEVTYAGTEMADSVNELVVISGKGGTGKTTVTAAFAHLGESQVLADNDVDAADMHLLLAPTVRERHDFYAGAKAEIQSDKCMGCGKCANACHFDAISLDGPANDLIGMTYRVDEHKCEGCGYCHLVCPVGAVSQIQSPAGEWYVSDTDHGRMAHARLGVAEENSGRLVSCVRERAAAMAEELGVSHILADGPPGTACPVIASLTGVDYALIVTEPTVSGVHDLTRVLELCGHFGVKAMVTVNKAGLNELQEERIREAAETHGARLLTGIPFDPLVSDALGNGKSVIAYPDGPARHALVKLWHEVRETMYETSLANERV
jgi:MinD superfamily P-loop ATPase